MYHVKRTVVAAIAMLGIVGGIVSCNKAKKTDDVDSSIGADHAMVEKTYSDVLSIADEAGNTGSVNSYKTPGGTILSNCATVTNDTTVTPHVLTIDFGATNCVCMDGINRRGQIIVSYTGRYKDPGHSHTIAFNNFFVDDNQVTGTKTVTNTGSTATGQPIYTITINGGLILANNGGTISWVSNRTRTWVAGYNTTAWADDTYDITGSGTLTRANGTVVAMNITTPLHVALDCLWIESGVVTLTPAGGAQRTLDYGNGTCDAQATFNVNGQTYNITLR